MVLYERLYAHNAASLVGYHMRPKWRAESDVAAEVAELRVRLTADASGFKAVLEQAAGTAEKTGHSIHSMGEDITHANQAIELAEKVYEAFAKSIEFVAEALEKPIEKAAEQDQAIAKLEATLQTTNQLTGEYSESLVKLAEAEGLVKNVSNDVVLGVERTLIAFGAQREELPKLVDAAIDLSTKTGNVSQAGFLLAKAMEGSTTALKRYGIIVDDDVDSTTKFQQVLDQIEKKFGGQAAAAAATYAGRVGIIGEAYTQLLEVIGRVITRNDAVLATLSGIARGFTLAKEEVEKFLGPIDEAVTALVAFANVKAAEGLDQLADATKDIPILSAALHGMAEGLHESNTAALEAKSNLAGIQTVVKEGEHGVDDLVHIIKEIGPTGKLVFTTIKNAVLEVSGGVKTLTETLNNADTKMKPLETLGKDIQKRIEEALPAIEDKLVQFGLRVGKKLVNAIIEGLFSVDLGAAIENQGGKALESLYDKTLDIGGKIAQTLLDALSPSEAGAAEIPPIELKADPTQANATVDALQTKARTPLVAPLDVNTKPAEAATTSFFTRFKQEAQKLASESLFGKIVAGLAVAAKSLPQLPPKPAGTDLSDAARAAANARADAALSAQIEHQKQLNAEVERETALRKKQADLTSTDASKQEAELERMRKAFGEINKGVELKGARTVSVSLDTSPAKTEAKTFEQEMDAFEKLNPKATLGLDKRPADTQLSDFEARVTRLESIAPVVKPELRAQEAEKASDELAARVRQLDGLTPDIHATVSLTSPKGASLQDMLDKAHEIDTIEPDLNVVLGKSFEESQSSVTALIEHYKILNETTATPKVDMGPAIASVQQGQATLQESTKAPVLLKITGDTTELTPAVQALTDFKTEAETPKVMRVDTSELAPATKALTDFQTQANTPIDPQVTTDSFTGSFLKMETKVKELDEATKKGFSFSADITDINEKLSIVRSDIAAGVDPITIDGEISKLQQKIEQAKKEIEGLSGTAKIDAQLKVDKAVADLAALQAKAQEPAVKEVDADTRKAMEKVAELNAAITAQINANIANVARGGGQITGNAASRDQLEAIVAQAGKDTAAAIAAGDTAKLQAIAADLRDFRASFGTFQGQSTIPTNIAKALSALDFALQGVGGSFARGQTDLGTTISNEINAARQEASRKAAEAKGTADATAATSSRTASATEQTNREIEALRAQLASQSTALDQARELLSVVNARNNLAPLTDIRIKDRNITSVDQALATIDRASTQQNANLARIASATEKTASALSGTRFGGFATSGVQTTIRRSTGTRGSLTGGF